MLGGAQVSAAGYRVPAVPVSSNPNYYFHGTASDDANRATSAPSATFDAVPPTGTTDITQTGSLGNSAQAANALSPYWISTAYTGSIQGTMHLDWWWSTVNAETVVLGEDLTVTVWADVNLATHTGTMIGSGLAHITPGTMAVESTADITGISGTVTTNLLVQASVVHSDTGHGNTVHYDSTTAPSFFRLAAASPSPSPSATATATPTIKPSGSPAAAPPGSPVFANYTSPQPLPHTPPANGTGVSFLVGEPSLGVDWVTNETMYQGQLNTFDVHFNYAVKPPAVTWNDRSSPATDSGSLDPRLITDHVGGARGTADRTIVDQLVNGNSAQAYSDTDGGSTAPPGNSADWIASSGGGFPQGPDHESTGAGRYHAGGTVPLPAPGGYPHAVYYCSQGSVLVKQPGPVDFCSRSDTGGATYGPAVPTYAGTQCGGLHGKPKVGPDGTVYLPNKDCTGAGGFGQAKGVVISTDNGVNWVVHNIPGTTTDGNQSDPDLAIGGSSGMGVLYYGYRDGDHHARVVVSRDEGATWTTPIDVGAPLGIQNIQFASMVAGDSNRAAFSFVGTTAPGDDAPDTFAATWYLFTSVTTDGGLTWNTVNDTPTDPVQRGGICMKGTGCTGSDRNMLDFIDSAVDNQGRIQVAYTDGCSGACETSAEATSGRFSSIFSLVSQVCGTGLFAAHDPGFNDDPACAQPIVVMPEAKGVVGFALIGLGGMGVFEIARRRRRRSQNGFEEVAG